MKYFRLVWKNVFRKKTRTILMVTHDPAAAERATITRHLNKGKLE